MIIRGTTPDMTFVLPFDSGMIERGFVTVQQNGTTVLEKPLSECTLEGKTLTVSFTQEDTLLLSASAKADIRIVALTVGAKRIESFKIMEAVGDTSKEGVI